MDFDVEAARGLEQAQQHLAEGNILERLVEDGFAHGANGRLELVDARVFGRPARDDMDLGDASVVALEESQKVLRQIILVHFVERSDNAKIERDITAVLRHENVPRVHIRMEKAIAEDLGEENLDALTR